MEKKIERLLKDVEMELTSLFREKLSKIVLYGSYARGDYDDRSDIDVIALIDDTDLKRYDKKVLRLNVDLSIRYDVELSLFIEETADFNENSEVVPLFKEIEREGVYIYAT